MWSWPFRLTTLCRSVTTRDSPAWTMTGMPRSPLTPSTICICNYPRCAGGPPVREGGRGRGSAAAVGRPRGQAAGLERGGGGRGGRGPGVLSWGETRTKIFTWHKNIYIIWLRYYAMCSTCSGQLTIKICIRYLHLVSLVVWKVCNEQHFLTFLIPSLTEISFCVYCPPYADWILMSNL